MTRRSRFLTSVICSLVLLGATQTAVAFSPGEPIRNFQVAGMRPNFNPATSDYALEQCDGKARTFSFTRASGATVVLNGRRVVTKSVKLTLTADQVVKVTAKLGSRERNWFIRCLPNDFPKLRATPHRPAPDGLYLLAAGNRPQIDTWQLSAAYYIIMDRNSIPLWYMRAEGSPSLLVKSPLGRLLTVGLPEGVSPSYGGREGNAFLEHELDGSTTIVYGTAPGDPIDIHTVQVLPNRNLLVMTMPVTRNEDLSSSFRQLSLLDVGGGGQSENCDVTNVTNVSVAWPAIRELNSRGDIVWSWDARDHIPASDSLLPALSDIEPGDGVDCVVDILHGNWISVTPDGSTVLFTARFASATYAIDRASGSVTWKLGGVPGEKSLRVSGDPLGERGPMGFHGGQIDTDGRLVLFDNRRILNETARGVIYRIDPVNRVATFEQALEPVSGRCSPGEFGDVCLSYSMGNAQHLPAGGVLVSWGYRPGSANVATEYDRNGVPLVSFTNLTVGQVSYSVTKVDARSWSKASLRANASSRKTIHPAWDSGLDWSDAPKDSAVGTIK